MAKIGDIVCGHGVIVHYGSDGHPVRGRHIGCTGGHRNPMKFPPDDQEMAWKPGVLCLMCDVCGEGYSFVEKGEPGTVEFFNLDMPF